MKKLAMVVFALSVMTGLATGSNVKSFCEYGTGVSLQLGVGGAIWDQTWGESSWDWYECQASPNVGFLNNNDGGILQTTTAGALTIDENMILKFEFEGQLTLTSYEEDSDAIAGQIIGDAEGLFVADLNAANAVVDEEAGTITIVFGAQLHDEADALIQVTETTGKFKSIHAIGPWKWHVNGTITLALVPDLSLQTNILAALGNPALLLGAQEEIVLAGSYYRDSSDK